MCNAVCNTLGRSHYAAGFSWGRATLGTVPFITWGAECVLAGHMAGGIAFGLSTVAVVRWLIAQLGRESGGPDKARQHRRPDPDQWSPVGSYSL